MNPWGQLQVNELTPSTQIPSFMHGVDAQSLISIKCTFLTFIEFDLVIMSIK